MMAMKKLLLLFCLLNLGLLCEAQTTITGHVFDAEKTALPGASIILTESFIGTSTNASGVFEFQGQSGDTVVLITSYIGFHSNIDTIVLDESLELIITLTRNPLTAQEFVVEATRVSNQSPITHQNISKDQIEQNNLAQDMPILLNQTISAVTTSDGGGGVGYTGIRIRGSDATRINVTVNGVPLNDSESHGVFWVNMPDFASSTNNIQIQRGVGTSSNGAAAFGATINLETNAADTASSVEINNSYGSFNTRKHNAIFSSGILANKFAFEGRYSYISTDGYIDRSSAELQSYFISGGYFGERLLVKAIAFAGQEKTHQAWWGTPESRIKNDDQAMLAHAANNGYTPTQTENLLSSGRTFNHYLYDNEIDNYGQDHYQVITGYQFSKKLRLNIVGHYTRGRGYFEQFKESTSFSSLGLNDAVVDGDTISSSDLVVQRWLDNHFYGAVYSVDYNAGNLRITIGGSANEYDGEHFGELVSSNISIDVPEDFNYYFSESKKQDVSNYAKADYKWNRFTFFGDVQYRMINYESVGTDNDLRSITINQDYSFLNPKLGMGYSLNHRHFFYGSFSKAAREPVRGDFTDAISGAVPMPEFLNDIEVGWNWKTSKLSFSSTVYAMLYKGQLVLTGRVNDVGAAIRANVPNSSRIGLESSLNVKFNKELYWQSNLTLSRNKIESYDQFTYDYTSGFDIITTNHKNTDIAFSPSIIAGSELGYKTTFGLNVAVLSKYVGQQYLDNTSDAQRSLDAYLVNDLRLSYDVGFGFLKRVQVTLLVNNILDQEYSSNGYTYSYVSGASITEDFYYPQAGINWLLGLKVRI